MPKRDINVIKVREERLNATTFLPKTKNFSYLDKVFPVKIGLISIISYRLPEIFVHVLWGQDHRRLNLLMLLQLYTILARRLLLSSFITDNDSFSLYFYGSGDQLLFVIA